MKERNIPNQTRIEAGEVDYLGSNVFRLNTGEFIVVRQIERRLPGSEQKWIGLDAGALLRLICKKTEKTTGQVYVEAKEWEKTYQYNPSLPELKYLHLGIELGVFHWLSEEEKGMIQGAKEGVEIIKI